MANYSSTYDLVSGALARAGELTTRSGASDYEAKVLEYINKMHLSALAGGTALDIELGETWIWGKAQNPGVIILQAPYSTGTITLTNASATATLSVGSTNSQLGNYLKIDGRPEFFRIAAHTALGTAMTLDANYTDTTGSGLTFKIYKLDYTLTTGILRLIAPMRTYKTQSAAADDTGKIDGIDKTNLDTDYPLHRLQVGVPDKFAMVYKTTAGVISVRFNKVVDTDTRIEYDYIPIPTDLVDDPTSFPLLPREHRVALEDGATYFLMLDKNDGRVGEAKLLAQSSLRALAEASKRERLNISRNRYGRLIPRRDLSNQKYIVQEVVP